MQVNGVIYHRTDACLRMAGNRYPLTTCPDIRCTAEMPSPPPSLEQPRRVDRVSPLSFPMKIIKLKFNNKAVIMTMRDAGNFDFPTGTPQPPEQSSSSSEQPEDEVGVHIYRLEKADAHCYLRWDTYRRILLDIVRCLRPASQWHCRLALCPCSFRLEFIPLQAEQWFSNRTMIYQRDLENNLFSLTRKSTSMRFPPDFWSHRPSAGKCFEFFLLYIDPRYYDCLDFMNTANFTQTKCTIFENNILWPAQDRTVHALTHGTYLRVIVPPPDDPALDTEVAIAITRDLTIEEPASPTLCSDCHLPAWSCKTS